MSNKDIKVDLSGNLDITALTTIKNALETLSGLFEAFPDSLQEISSGVSDIGKAFENSLDPSIFDTSVFTSVFVAGLASMLIALEMFKEEIGKVSINVDASTIKKNLTDIQTKIDVITTSNMSISFNTTNIEEAGSSFDRIVSIIGSVIGLLGIGATVWEHFASKKPAEDMKNAIEGCAGSIEKLSRDLGEIFDDDSIANKAKLLGENIARALIDGLSDNVVDASKSLSKIEKGADDYKGAMKDVEKATDKVNDKKISFGGGFIAAIGIVATLGAALFELISSNEEFSAKMEEAWGLIKEAFEPIHLPLFFYRKRKAVEESRLLQRAFAA